jgi:hypothetical protein
MSEQVAERVGVLSASDVKVLRKADRVLFARYRQKGQLVSTIVAYGYRGDDVAGWVIYAPSEIKGFELLQDAEGRDGSCLLHAYDNVWRTVAGLLKAGDALSVRFVADGRASGYLQNAEVVRGHGAGSALYADALYLDVQRGARKLTFLLQVSVCPDNTARMVRRAF